MKPRLRIRGYPSSSLLLQKTSPLRLTLRILLSTLSHSLSHALVGPLLLHLGDPRGRRLLPLLVGGAARSSRKLGRTSFLGDAVAFGLQSSDFGGVVAASLDVDVDVDLRSSVMVVMVMVDDGSGQVSEVGGGRRWRREVELFEIFGADCWVLFGDELGSCLASRFHFLEGALARVVPCARSRW